MRTRSKSLRALFLPLLLCTILAACGSSTSGGSGGTTATSTSQAVTLNVFAAASLTESFTQIGKQFQEAHSGMTVKFNFGGSQLLEQQMANGAPSDVFASADETNMQKANKAGLVDSSQVFAKNKLVVIVPVNNSKVKTLKDLANRGVKIDIEDATVPAGKYSLQVLDKMAQSADYGASYEAAVKGNFVSKEDNVKAVVTKVELGEADAGFVYLTDVTSSVAPKVTELTIPDNFNVIAQYPIATTKSSKNMSDANAFVQYVLSSDGEAVLKQYGFISPTA